jgi:predicted homoserine dehydrogenase-like protein
MRTEMHFITHAAGPYYLHFRPYHLCDLETPQSIAEAVLLGEVTATAEDMHAEVVCTAKRDIAAGERLDGIGGADWHGLIMTWADARARRAVPIGLGAGAVARRAVARGDVITEDDVSIDETTFICRLRRLQDALYA